MSTTLPETQRAPFVSLRFTLNPMTKLMLQRRKPDWGYGAFSEFIFYRTYSRDGESWADVITRVIEGTFSIRKNHYIKHDLAWDEERMQAYAHEMALSAFKGEWGPPGRGYWAMGTEQVYERGAFALNNCGFVDIRHLSTDLHWVMDGLMLGCGVGFSAYQPVKQMLKPTRKGASTWTVRDLGDGAVSGSVHTSAWHEAKAHWDVDTLIFHIPDSREGWCDALALLVESYETGGPTIWFRYDLIRPMGAPIGHFGGTASGPKPLRKMLWQVRRTLESVTAHPEGWTDGRLITDLVNFIGCCIVAGNVRRSATIALGHPDDPDFADLKNYEKYPYRIKHGWMSNNSYVLSERHHFEQLVPQIAAGVKRNGEPGFYNLKAVRSFGRLGDRVGTLLPNGSLLREDMAVGINPCGEVPLESYELCCLAEWYPTRCMNSDGTIDWHRAMRAAAHAAFYTQTVQLLPTHRPETNAVVERNRRTGVSLAGAAALRDLVGMTQAIKLMEDGYATIRRVNKDLSEESGVPEAIRVTAEKPSGTTSLMLGVPAGSHWPTSGYIRRAARVDAGRHDLRTVLDAAGVPSEPDLYSQNTMVYYFPVQTPGADQVRPVHEVSMWEQADFAAVLAQHFVDNAVSVTVTFDPLTRAEKQEAIADCVEHGQDFEALVGRMPEGDAVEYLIASYIGKLKSMSMLPRLGHGYAQAPETAITKDEYLELVAQIGELDWAVFADRGIEEVYCSTCETV